MDQKLIRLSAEHVAGAGSDCAHLMYALLCVFDRDAVRSEQTFEHARLASIAERLSSVAEQLFSIRRELVDLRYSRDVEGRLDPTLASELEGLREVGRRVDQLVSQAVLLCRAEHVRQLAPLDAPSLEAAARATCSRAQSALSASGAGSDASSKAVWDALTVLRSAHSHIPFHEADEIEHRRWRE